MAIILPHGININEIRVLQEFKRLNAETLTLAQIKAIKHPAGSGGDVPAQGLVGKGYLEAADGQESFTLTQKGKDFLAIQAVPETESPASDDDTPVE
jgi:hypothetical protein